MINLNSLEKTLNKWTQKLYNRNVSDCSLEELYNSLLNVVKELMGKEKINSGKKKVYYISAEFLIGKLLINNLINLGIYEEVASLLQKYGKDLQQVEEMEPEPSLGNGGLGRLAACFLDSMATLGLPAAGIGLNYHFGLFRQVFDDCLQVAKKNDWIEEQSWLVKIDVTYEVHFGGCTVKSRRYDIDVCGYGGGRIPLHLFDLETVEEDLVTEGIVFDKEAVQKNLTLFLYPDDSDEAGHLLRIYQQYFMVSNAARLILDEMKEKRYDLHHLPEHAVIQINDTHPVMIIPELIRILTEEEGFAAEEAMEVVSKTCAYTNHTILAEALEKWPLRYLEKAVPQLVPIIKRLDKKIGEQYSAPQVQIIDAQNRVHMAHIAIHYGFSVNGVAAIHTDILKKSELKQFYLLYPQKFHNMTNGITFRRWLFGCNRELTELLIEKLGQEVKRDAGLLKGLLAYREDAQVLDRLAAIKQLKKQELVSYIAAREGIRINPESIFDIQIKRLHEYKRQQMNALYIIHKYLEIKSGKLPPRPISFIFGAKAAPAYVIAQDIIHLLLVLQEIVNKDRDVAHHMQVVMVENYNVSYAQKLIPACDVSEQISLASKEASGTGNMKLMLNGAITLGTEDGANVEISQLVGKENIYIFGESSDEVIEHYAKADYVSKELYEKHPIIKRAVDFIVGEQAMTVGHRENLERLHRELVQKDWFMTLLDLEDYIRTKEQVFMDYENREKWKRMSLVNIAMAGYFSSDRTITQYNEDIWHL